MAATVVPLVATVSRFRAAFGFFAFFFHFELFAFAFFRFFFRCFGFFAFDEAQRSQLRQGQRSGNGWLDHRRYQQASGGKQADG
jgi:hypothetical protein